MLTLLYAYTYKFLPVIIALSHIPVVNKTVTPLIQDHTKVEKVVHDKTDKIFNKYIIEGKVLKEWTKDLWNK